MKAHIYEPSKDYFEIHAIAKMKKHLLFRGNCSIKNALKICNIKIKRGKYFNKYYDDIWIVGGNGNFKSFKSEKI